MTGRCHALSLGLAASFLALATFTASAQPVPHNRTLVVAQNFDPQSLWPNGTTASTSLRAGSWA